MHEPRRTALCGLLLLGALGAQDPATSGSANTALHAIADANNRFAFDLYARLCTTDGNLFFAPLSARLALAMTASGARDTTATQMNRALHLPGDDTSHAALGAFAKQLQSDGPGVAFAIANAIWAQQGSEVRDEFARTCRDAYAAGLDRVDFAHATEAARGTINRWVSERTNERIPELLKPGILDPTTCLVLTNAVDFVGHWKQPFDPERTTDGPFTIPSTEAGVAATEVRVPMMNVFTRLGLYADETVQVIELPYAGGRLSMLVVLPVDAAGLGALERSLTAYRLATWIAGLRMRPVTVQLPRFQLRCARRLDPVLEDLGMTDAFAAERADFSGIDGRKDLVITAVVHEAFVKVDEAGTEASAATGVVMGRTGGVPPRFRADHPFVFAIRDRESGAIVFLGRVVDPSVQ